MTMMKVMKREALLPDSVEAAAVVLEAGVEVLLWAMLEHQEACLELVLEGSE